MRTSVLFLALLAALAFGTPGLAQEETGHDRDTVSEAVEAEAMHTEHAAESATHGESHVNVDLWKTVNFTILAIGLGWLIRKFGSSYFRGQTEKIQQGIVEAQKAREEAEARAAEIDRRMAGLEAEIEALRAGAKSELAGEEERLRAQTEQTIARVEANAKQEIESVTKQARKELRAYASELALELAREKVRSRMTPEISANLMGRLVSDLDRLSQRVN